MKLLLSKREAAKRLGIDRATTLQQLIDSGRIRIVKIGSRVRIPATELDRLCTDFVQTAAPTKKRAMRLHKESAHRPPTPADIDEELRRRGFLKSRDRSGNGMASVEPLRRLP